MDIAEWEIEKKISDLSLEYSVLSDYTAFFGKIKNIKKSTKKIKIIEIPIKQIRKRQVFHSCYKNGKGRGQNLKLKRLVSDPVDRIKGKGTQDYLRRKDSLGFFSKIGGAIGGLFSKAPIKDDIPMKIGIKKDKGKSKDKMRSKMKNRKKMIVQCKPSSNEMDSGDSSSPQNENTGNAGLKEKKRSSTRSDIPYHSTEALEGYEKLIQFQDPDGYFTDLSSEYSHLLANSPPEDLERLVKKESMIDEIWTTILAVLILETHFKSAKGEWVMIAKKARSFLKKNLEKDTSIDQFLFYIS